MKKINKTTTQLIRLARFMDYIPIDGGQKKYFEASDDWTLTLHNDLLHIEGPTEYIIVPVANIKSLVLKEGEIE